MSVTAPTLARLRRTRGRQQATVRWLSVLAPVLLVTLPVAAWHADPHPSLSGRGLVVTAAMVAFVIAVLGRNATAARRDTAVHRTFVGVLLSASVVLALAQPRGPGVVCVLLGVLCVAVLLPGRLAVVTLPLGFAVVGAYVLTRSHDAITLVVLVAVAALYALLFLAWQLALANRHAEAMLVELERTRAAHARAAGLAERQHLAREMHDVLAHSLSGMLLQLEAARLMAARQPADPRLAATLGRAQSLGRSGLDEARRAIGALRDEMLPGPEGLAELAESFALDHATPCEFSVAGTPRSVPTEARLTVYRVAQESLTNVGRHARPERVQILLAYESAVVRLVVEDVGTAASDRPRPGDGYGLTGMRERAELLGGTLAAGPTAHGFRVELTLPC